MLLTPASVGSSGADALGSASSATLAAASSATVQIDVTPGGRIVDGTLPGGNLSLIRTQADSSVSPMGHVFEGFAPWVGGRLLPVSVEAPEARAYDQDLPLVVAAAVVSADGASLHAVLVNASVDTPVDTSVSIRGFAAGRARIRRLAADTADADNDHGVIAVALGDGPLPLPLGTLTLPPHSVSFLDFYGPPRPRSPRGRTLPGGWGNSRPSG